jgi:peptidoglycan/LPS O-acetylase OafA/YrhL
VISHYKSTEFITGLRGIAAFLVFLIHSGGGGLRELSSATNIFVDWAKYGVDIFFVISGFTIFYQFYEKKYSLKNFLIQRIMRISVPYWPLLVLLFIMGILNIPLGINYWGHGAQGYDISWINWLLHATYLNFWSAKYSNTIIGIEWSLGIEVFYYIFLGIVLSSSLFKSSQVLFSLLLGLSLYVISLIGNDLINMSRVSNYLDIHWSPMLYGYMFMLGGAAYFCRRELERLDKECMMLKISNLVSIFVGAIFILNLHFLYFPNIPLMFALMTFALLTFVKDESFIGKLLIVRPVLLFGSISYSFYLWHIIILNTDFLNLEYLSDKQIITFIYKFLISVIIASVWFYVFEQKIYNNLKRRLRAND